MKHQPAPDPPEPPASVAADFRAIFEGESDYVWCTLRRLGVREDDLEDLTHDVFVAVFRHLEDYDPARPLRPWLFGFAVRIASEYRRRARHRLEVVGDVADHADRADAPDDQLARCQSQALVVEALAALDMDRRTIFVLHDLDGTPIPETAAALQIPLNTAYSRLRLAREQFAAAVRRIRARRGER